MKVLALALVLLAGCATSHVWLDDDGRCREVIVQSVARQVSVECADARVYHEGMSPTFAHMLGGVAGFLAGFF